MTSPSILLTEVSFAWPDGTVVLDDVTVALGAGRTGLVGDNGTGKTTVLRLVAGELAPTSGTVSTRGTVAHLPQHLTLRTGSTVAELLGVAPTLAALRAIESGRSDQALYDAVGDDWDVEARATAVLGELGLAALTLDRRVGTLSGGESMLVALAGTRLAAAPVVLLDEPTNNLDRDARFRCYDAISGWSGALVVVSHDEALLDLMDDTAELRRARLAVFGGPFGEFVAAVEEEQRAAEQAVRTAEQTLRKEQRQRREAETVIARRERAGRKARENKVAAKIVMNQRRLDAQVSSGKLRARLDDRVEAARRTVDREESRLRDDERVRIVLPDPEVGAGRRLAELRDGERTFVVQGPERVALTGRNGVGKTRLLTSLVDPRDGAPESGPAAYAVPLTDRIGYLPQRIDGPADDLTALDTVLAAAPGASAGEVRAQLARFRLRGDDVFRAVGDLSGGERFRVALARLLLAQPAHQLLVLDEPTNNLDRSTVQALVDALAGYRGGLLVVSHDEAFLDRLGIDTRLVLEAPDRLTGWDHAR